MNYIIKLLLVISFIGVGYGFYIKPEDTPNGDLFIGLSLMLLIFITMPLFIYRHWKNKDVKDYMLTKENIKKMREFNDSKD